MDHPFRNAIFGGFNRQDVLAYLENTSKEAARQQEEYQQKLAELQASAAQQEAELAQQLAQVRLLTQENEELRAKQEQTNIALSSSRTECSQTAQVLKAAQREAETLRAKIAALEPDAAAYAAIKERAAGVELDAHRRAQAVQDAAQLQACQLHRQMEQWIQKVEREYDTLRSEVESTVSHAADQLEKAEKSLNKVTALMGEQDVALESLAQTYLDAAPDKAAASIPASEQE